MITVRTPATSANCSIGFDCLGLALDWKSKISFEPAETLKITGCPQEYAGEDNLVYQSFVYTCKACHVEVPGVHIHIDSDIPFARGLGSSSQCIAAGILGADALLGLHLGDRQKLDLATQIEGHPDNVAPALRGGLCSCVTKGNAKDGNQEVLPIDLGAHGWHVLVVIPDYEVSTKEARKVLPASIPLHDAAMQVGHALLFEYAWVHGDENLLFEACVDVVHEPSRSKLIKDYPDLYALAQKDRIPFWISGSGPTMAFVSQNEDQLRNLQHYLACREVLEEMGSHLKLRLCKVSDQGAEVNYG